MADQGNDEEVDYGVYGDDADGGFEDMDDLAELEKHMKEQEEIEASKNPGEASTSAGATSASGVDGKASAEEKAERDDKSVFVGNVAFGTTTDELVQFFSDAGSVERVTILVDRSGHPKGYAYIEFTSKEAVANALILNGAEFKERNIKVVAKRQNVHSFQLRGRGGFRGGRGGYPPRGGYRGGRGGYPPRGGFRGGRGGYYPAPHYGGGRGGGAPRPFVPRGRGRGGGPM